MKSVSSLSCLLAAALVCAAPFTSHALTIGSPVTVQTTSVVPGTVVTINVTGFYNGGAHAGVYNLSISEGGVNGSYASFCIDPFHYSPSSPNGSYYVSTLNSVSDPVNVTPVFTSAQATLINRLLNHYYFVGMGNQQAADLQVAIWETVGGTSFSATGYSDLWYNNYVFAAKDASAADHLTVRSAASQDYVLINRVPDAGTTVVLLGMALLALQSVRRILVKPLSRV